MSSEPKIFQDIQQDGRFDEIMQGLFRRVRIRAMAALPLWAGTTQTGVLLLEAEENYELSEDHIRPYGSLLGHVAVAVENQRLLAETNVALAEVEATQRRYVVQPWETYRARPAGQHYEQVREGIPLFGNELAVPQLSPLDDGRQAGAGDQISATSASESRLTVPLTVHDEVVGVVGLEEMYQREWAPDEAALVAAISDQLAQAYENLRLIDETQQRAARESRISDIGDKIREAQSLEEALQIAIREVGESLGMPQTAVKLEISDT